MKIDFKKGGKLTTRNLFLGGVVVGVVYVIFRSGAEVGSQDTVETIEDQFAQLSLWDRLLLGVGIKDPDDVFEKDPAAVSGVRIGRS